MSGMSVENFEKLLHRLEELEDLVIEQSENDINNYRDENKLVLSERDSELFPIGNAKSSGTIRRITFAV
jgi:hypothetical protein